MADSGAFPYLRTHPLTVERMSEARNRMLLAGPEAVPRPSVMHAMMQARARVLMDTNPQALQRLAGGATSSTQAVDRIAALYAGALARSRLGQGAAAEELAVQAQRLAEAMPAREADAERVLALLPAEARLAGGDGVGAWRALEAAAAPSADMRNDRSVLTLRAQAALKWHERDARAAAGAVRDSTEALQTWLSEHPNDAAGWQLLAGTAEALGQKLRSMRASAESQAALGDLTGAIDRLRAAQAVARAPAAAGGNTQPDFIDASIIDTRLRQLLEERRQLVLEARQRGGGGGGGDGRDGR